MQGSHAAVVQPFYGQLQAGEIVGGGDRLIGGTGNDLLATGYEDRWSVYVHPTEAWRTVSDTTYNPDGLVVNGLLYAYVRSNADMSQDMGRDRIEGNAGSDVLAGRRATKRRNGRFNVVKPKRSILAMKTEAAPALSISPAG